MRSTKYPFLLVLIFCSLGFSSEPPICLLLIVKNDEKVILPCLNSIKEIIDCISLCDMGSSDTTIQKIEFFSRAEGIPLVKNHFPCRDFNYNTHLVVEQAKQKLKELGQDLSECYLLLLDPNMYIKISPAFAKQALKADAYSILEGSRTLSYYKYKAHLVRASLPWKCTGPTPEFWSCDQPYECQKLTTMQIEEFGEDDYTIQKSTDRMANLQQALKFDPENSRYLFYLAQSQKSLKLYEEAIAEYKKYLEHINDKEEAWFCKYMMGECYEAMDRWEQALYWYLEAFQFYPQRTDSLKKVANYYRLHGQNELAYFFAKYASLSPYPNQYTLFSSSPFYDYQFAEEISIAAYYTRFKDEGYEASNELILNRNTPWYIKDQTYRNLIFYVHPLPQTQFHTISLDLPLIRSDSPDRYNPMNPSIQKTKEGYKVICRAVNYTQVGAKSFNTIDEQGVFRTKNFLLHYDRELQLHAQQEIIESLPRERNPRSYIEGLDDCRIFEWNHQSWFTCNTSDTNPTGNFQISLCKLGEDERCEINSVEKLVPLKGPDPYRCEKNWLPFVKDNKLHLLYSCDPFVLYTPDLDTGDCQEILRYDTHHDFSHFRGSAGPIPFDEGYLMIVHEVIHYLDYSRCYLHRFVFLDQNFQITRVSKPFIFKHTGIEFCCSMTIDHSGEKLIIALGIEDREAYLCLVDLQTVRSQLQPLPAFVSSPFLK